MVDFGCGGGGAFQHLKTIDSLEDIIGVDCDVGLLEARSYIVKPLICDYIHRRAKALRLRLFHGSMLDNDSRLQHCDAACLIEV